MLLPQEFDQLVADAKRAVWEGDAKRLEQLLSTGPPGLPKWAFKETKDDDKDTLMMMAAKAGHVEVAKVLARKRVPSDLMVVEGGEPVDAWGTVSTIRRRTPLLEAVQRGHVSAERERGERGSESCAHLDILGGMQAIRGIEHGTKQSYSWCRQ